jgi:hypothetical protein
MMNFLNTFDWNSFWMNVLVNTLFLVVASFLLPVLLVRKFKRKNKKYIVKKTSSIIQEICEFINKMPFKDDELTQKWLSISTTKRDLKNHRFVGLSKINVLNPVVFPKIIIVANSYFIGFDINTSFEKIIEEKKKLEVFRLKLESIISIYSLHVDDEVISEISDLCLDIKAFDIKFEINYGIDDLIESGYTDREYIFGILDIAKIYEKILITLKSLINNKNFEIELEKNGYS